ncbi:hypothetical protein B566_EDAN008135 [Ephemera danica]|nr:hypothetical protein B566_EDAN008135 [Ephemera danica]
MLLDYRDVWLLLLLEETRNQLLFSVAPCHATLGVKLKGSSKDGGVQYSKQQRRREQQGWWGSIFQAAKEKSAEVMEFVRRDLDEFSSAVKSEATSVVNSTATVLKDKLKLDDEESTAGSMKKSFSTLLGQVSGALNPQPEDEDEEAILIHGSEPVPLSPLQVQLYALASDAATFLLDPCEDKELEPRYAAWLDCQEEQGMSTNRLSRLLANNPHLQTNYEKLVPSEISHELFWQRFLFRKALLEDEEARKQAKQRRLEEEKQRIEASVKQTLNTELRLGQVELSEEEQIRLLRDYELECADATKMGADPLPLLTNHYSPPPPGSGDLLRPELRIRDKRDMVIVGEGASTSSSGQTSVADKESNDGDWEKEFDLEDEEGEEEVAAG